MSWQPIETAPKNKVVLLWHTVYQSPVAGHCIVGDLWAVFAPGVPMLFQSHLVDNPTHWMPLPGPPEGSKT